PLILLLQWLVTKKVSRIYLASTALVLVLGTATLFFHNPTFLYWKPTVLNWVIALVFFGSQWIGDKPIVQRMMGHAADLASNQWRTLNLMWVAFFIFSGAVNIYVAYNFSEAFWVKFKLFGMLGLTVVFVAVQSLWLASEMKKYDALQDKAENQ
ncbi:MAG: septation protein IspZ, partial [Gammaproteobacteria bacterium]|nr:septation protein IspZ [Gammaproteobacteria bacterium]